MSGPLPAYLAPLTVPASWIYGAAVAFRNRRFDRGAGVASIGKPVISVGNLTTGGVGKTPMVAWIADHLIGRGARPVIAMRGYGARPPDLSDEQAEYALRLPGVPVVANPDRTAAMRAFLGANEAIDCVLLDDGFQHRRLARDLDLVLIDATRRTPADRLLPAGHLREPPDSLRRADAVIVTRAAAVDQTLAAWVRRHHGRPPVAWSRHVWTGLMLVRGAGASAESAMEPVEWLAGKRVLTMLGVGHPESVIGQLRQAGAVVAVNVPARDHEQFDRQKLQLARTLAEGLDAIVLTAKDWARAQHRIDLSTWPTVVVPQLAIEVFEGQPALENLILQALSRQP